MANLYIDPISGVNAVGTAGTYDAPFQTIQYVLDNTATQKVTFGDTLWIGNTGNNGVPSSGLGFSSVQGSAAFATPLRFRGWNVAGGNAAPGRATIDGGATATQIVNTAASSMYVTWRDLRLRNTSGANPLITPNMRWAFVNCELDTVANDAINGTADYLTVINCDIHDCTEGIVVSQMNPKIIGCRLYNITSTNTAEAAIRFTQLYGVVIANRIRDCNCNGIYASSTNCDYAVLLNNLVQGKGATQTANTTGIKILGDWSTVFGNIVLQWGNTGCKGIDYGSVGFVGRGFNHFYGNTTNEANVPTSDNDFGSDLALAQYLAPEYAPVASGGGLLRHPGLDGLMSA